LHLRPFGLRVNCCGTRRGNDNSLTTGWVSVGTLRMECVPSCPAPSAPPAARIPGPRIRETERFSGFRPRFKVWRVLPRLRSVPRRAPDLFRFFSIEIAGWPKPGAWSLERRGSLTRAFCGWRWVDGLRPTALPPPPGGDFFKCMILLRLLCSFPRMCMIRSHLLARYLFSDACGRDGC
jgi:hypothetical protein